MSLLKIADAVGTCRGLTESSVTSVGASIFIHEEITDEQRTQIEHELNPQAIKTVERASLGVKTQVDL